MHLEVGNEISGAELAPCAIAAMLHAGSGVQHVSSTDGTESVVRFRWDPDYAMSVESDETAVVVEGDGGWARVDGTWYEADPNSTDPDVAVATTIVDGSRAFGEPAVMTAYLSAAGSWKVVAQESVPGNDPVITTAYRLEPVGDMSVGGVAVSDVVWWMTPQFLGAAHTATASFGGITTRTDTTFREWGTPVLIEPPSDR